MEEWLTNGMSETEETDQLVKVALDKVDELGQKQEIVLQLNRKTAANKQLWAAFVQRYPRVNEILMNEQYNAALSTKTSVFAQHPIVNNNDSNF